MGQDKGTPFWLTLLGVSFRSAVLMFARIFIMSWYAYYALHFSEKVQGESYLYWIMLLLSVFGLWRLLELLAKWAKLTDGAQRT